MQQLVWEYNNPQKSVKRYGQINSDTPEKFGGGGCDFSYQAVAQEEQAYAGPDFMGPGFGLHS